MKIKINKLHDENNFKAFITGTRSTDPFCQNLQFIQKMDQEDGWPDAWRIMPIYDWSYQQIWEFILENQLEYCQLYKLGYTYVGDRENSIINPFLQGGHAASGNDNNELFSRSYLYNQLPRKQGKLLFEEDKVQLIIQSENQFQLSESQKNYIYETVQNYATKNQYNIQINWKKITISFTKSDDVFQQKILELKKQPLNFDKLYVIIIYCPENEKIKIEIQLNFHSALKLQFSYLKSTF